MEEVEQTVDDQTMDDIWQQGVDADKVNETTRQMLLARGPYVTTPPLTVSGQRYAASERGEARTVFYAYGPVTWTGAEEPSHKGINGGEPIGAPRKGRIRFAFSPEARYFKNEDGTSTPDAATKAWAMLVKTYTKSAGRAPATAQDIKTYLETYPVKLTIGTVGLAKGDPRNGVFYIGPVV